MTRVRRGFIVLFALTAVSLALALWLERARPAAPEDLRKPVGPSTVIRGIRERAAAREQRERRARALELEAALHGDGGAI
jgi:hypothetical protein